MARGPNQVETVLVKISTTPLVVESLEALVATGFFGKNHAEAAERLLAATLRRMVLAGELNVHGTDTPRPQGGGEK